MPPACDKNAGGAEDVVQTSAPAWKRAAKMGRNPATGEAIKIKASKKIAFRPAKELKEAADLPS